MNTITSMTNSQEQTIPYEQLEPFPPNINYVHLLREVSNGVIDSKSDKQQIEMILLMRRMRKHQRPLFDVTFDNIVSRFVDKFLSQKSPSSPVIYHSLIFINEIFSEYSFEFNDNWLELLYPAVQDIAFGSDETMRQFASKVIQSYAINMKYTTAIEVLFTSLEEVYDNQSKSMFLYDMFKLYFQSTDIINLQFLFDWNIIVHNLPLGTPLLCTTIQSIIVLLKTTLDKKWDEFLSSLNEKNRTLINRLLSNNSLNN